MRQREHGLVPSHLDFFRRQRSQALPTLLRRWSAWCEESEGDLDDDDDIVSVLCVVEESDLVSFLKVESGQVKSR